LRRDLAQHHDASALYHADARATYNNSEDFNDQNARINDTAARSARWLAQSYPDVVVKVYYPKKSAKKAAVRWTDLPGVGHGGLSIVVHPHASCKRAFFEALDVPLGPSLGKNFTLVCPYALLAHYHEREQWYCLRPRTRGWKIATMVAS
jgi:cystathionine gamma-synthase